MFRHRLLWLVCISLLSLPLSLNAQTTTGTVRGYVKDQNGTPISGAQVQVRNPETGVERATASRNDGSYVLPGLAPATYELSVRHIGFTPQRWQVTVQIGATQTHDFSIQAGAVELQAVTVETGGAQAELRTSEVATNVTPQQIERLPTPSRNFLDLAALAPGVSVTEDRINGTRRTFSSGAQGANDINVFIDGVSLKNDLTGGGIAGQDASRGNPFPRNAVQEYRVIAQNFKAEYAKSSSAIVTATTKSGSNEWHGNAFFGYQNKGLVALDTFQRANPSFTKPEYRRDLAGLSVGGPLIRDRLHMFASYEGNYQDRANLVNITPPPTGAFPSLDTVNLAQYNRNFGSPFRSTLLFGKLNYVIGSNSTAEMSFNHRHETDIRDFGGNRSFQSGVNFRNKVSVGLVKHSYFTGAWLNEAQLTYQRFRRNPSPNTPGLVNRVFERAAGGAQIGSDLSIQDFIQRRIGFRNDVTYTGWQAGGNHVLKAGVTLDLLNYDVNKRNRDTPQFFYSDTINRSGRILPFQYRTPYRLIVQSGAPGLSANNTQLGVYMQDDWSPTPQLTLNLGMRWDFESHMLNYDYVTPQDVRDTIRAYYSQLIIPIDTNRYYTDGTQRERFYGAFQPRLGFSYSLDAQNRTVLFGGFGIFYDRSLFDISVDETLKLQRPEYTILFAHPDSTPAAGEVVWNNSYLTTNRSIIDPLVTTGPSAAREVWLIANDTKAPKSTQWNLGIRRQFGSLLVSAAYVGSRGYDQLIFNWANLTVNANGGCCVGGNFGHGFSNILYTTESGKTWYDALQLQINRAYRNTGGIGWGAGLNFTYGTRSLQGVDNTDDQFAFPQDAIIKKHPANDEKSRLVANWTVDLPYIAGIQFSGLITLGSGQLFNVGSRFDLANFDPGAFAPPKSAFIVGKFWRYRNVDVRLRKDFPSVSGRTLAITADLFNAFNFSNYSGYNLPTNTSDPNFGKPNGVGTDPRRLQLGAELAF
jgi:Carboxypeptidase regulatory-like domain/TonB dependent receptor/TonB-dependent Receptor Plug Domain